MSVESAPVCLPLPVEEVPADEQLRILTAAQGASSRAELCQTLYGAKAGRPYTKLQRVLDAAGLLLPPARPQEKAA